MTRGGGFGTLLAVHKVIQRVGHRGGSTGRRGLRFGLVAGLVLLGGAGPAPAQHRITFKNGVVHECRILGFENGIFTVELSNGVKASTSQANVARIEFDVGAATPVPPEFSRVASPAPAAVPAPVARPVAAPPPPAVRKPPARVPPRPGIELTLASHWQHRLGRGDTAHRDAGRLLAACGTPRVDLGWKDITLWGKVTYLMPVEEAKTLLGLGISTKKGLSCSLFPPSSFFAHEFSGHFEDGMTRLTLVTDFAGQVVAVQLADGTTRTERWMPQSTAYSSEWSLYNFVDDARKANSHWEIGFHVAKGPQRVTGYPPSDTRVISTGPVDNNEGVIRIDSDLFSVKKNQWGLVEESRSRERVRLLVAQPVVDLMLYVIQQSR